MNTAGFRNKEHGYDEKILDDSVVYDNIVPPQVSRG